MVPSAATANARNRGGAPPDPDAGVGFWGSKSGASRGWVLSRRSARAAADTWRGAVGIARAVAGMVTGRSELDVRGPIGIITITGEAARQGIDALISLAIGLNLNLGLLNLFPIPVLDGGWLVLLALEGIRGRPLEARAARHGAVRRAGHHRPLMIYAFYQDVIHLNM